MNDIANDRKEWSRLVKINKHRWHRRIKRLSSDILCLTLVGIKVFSVNVPSLLEKPLHCQQTSGHSHSISKVNTNIFRPQRYFLI